MHAVITGAKGGIGRACAKLFHSHNYAVSSWDLPEVDITDANSLDDALATAISTHGPIHTHPLRRDTTTRYAVIGTRNFQKAPRNQRARSGQYCQPNRYAHAATTGKFSSASESGDHQFQCGHDPTVGHGQLRGFQSRCNLICEIARAATSSAPYSLQYRLARLHRYWDVAQHVARRHKRRPEYFCDSRRQPGAIPSRRTTAKIATDDEIAQACYFLASPAASHITMHDLRVDGGATLDS